MTRYSHLPAKLAVIVFACSAFAISAVMVNGCGNSSGRRGAGGLMVDLLTDPGQAVITNPEPLFGWTVEDQRPGASQSAFRVMVASSRERLEEDDPDMWDSGKTMSSRSIGVTYAGRALEPSETYWWKVLLWDHEGKPGRWSGDRMFRTGELDPAGLRWPGESRWVRVDGGAGPEYLFEDRHAIRYHDTEPVSVEINQAGNHFISFEKAAFGTLKLVMGTGSGSGTGSDTLIIHLGEKSANGGVDRRPGGSISYKRVTLPLEPGRDEYLLELPRQYSNYPNSQVLASHMPEVTAFRYAEIEGWPGGLTADQVRRHTLLYRFDDDASSFGSSDKNLNLIWELCKHTLKVTPFLGLYIDGTRERMPYEADAYIQQISHYCVDREFAIQRCTNAFLIYNPSWPTEWHLHIVLMAWADYMATGDVRFLEKYYDELRKKTLLPLAREDGLISTRTGLVTEEFLEGIHFHGSGFRDIVDWPQGTPANEEPGPGGFASVRVEGETDGYVFSEINTVVNAFHYRNLVLMAGIADVLGKSEDVAFFRERSVLVKESFNARLLDHHTGLYLDGEGVGHSSLHANMFPVAFGLAPVENYPRLREFFISRGMACSPYGAPYLFDALYEVGAEDYALELLTSEGSRSWMNMIGFGTTITSEAWDIRYKNNMTWNHAWGASPAWIITRKIFGIEPLEPGFGKILISPRPGTLRSAEIRSPTIRGEVFVRFEQDREADPGGASERSPQTLPINGFTMEVVIPANTEAHVRLPEQAAAGFTLYINGKQTPLPAGNGSLLPDALRPGRHIIELKKESQNIITNY